MQTKDRRRVNRVQCHHAHVRETEWCTWEDEFRAHAEDEGAELSAGGRDDALQYVAALKKIVSGIQSDKEERERGK